MSTDDRNDLLRSLGVAPEGLREIEQIPLRHSGVARGLVARAPVREYSENFVNLVLGTVLPFGLTHHALEPSLVRIEDVLRFRTVSGAVEVHGGTAILDGRDGRPAGVVVETSEGAMLVDLDAACLRVSKLGPGEDDATANHPAPSPDLLSHPAPSLRALIGERSCEAWLRHCVEALAASPRLLDQVASVGTVVRLWLPAAEEGRAILEQRAEAPGAVAAAWIRSLPPAERAAIERLAVQQSAALRARLQELVEADEDASPDEILRLLHERDALESVQAMLWLAGEGRALARELARLDEAAVTSFSAIPPSDALESDELLQAVLTSEPDAWWGELAAS